MDLGLLAALGAAVIWAAASIVSHRPVLHFGVLDFTRIQLPASALLLGLVVTWQGNWHSLNWSHWLPLSISGLVGILLGDFALHSCLKYGGPRRMQLLFALNAPMASLIGFLALGERLSWHDAIGGLLILAGISLAILYNSPKSNSHQSEAIEGHIGLVIFWGLLAALCQAIGLIVIKPMMDAGTDPLAASAARTIGSAAVLLTTLFWPAFRFRALTSRDRRPFMQTVLAGWMGYVGAMTLLIFALQTQNTGIVAVVGSTAPVMILPLLWWLHKHPPSLPSWIGAFLVIAGIATLSDIGTHL
ncbi:MAG: DMT family transporter [Cohaesibacter sp.]|nr:DMT family transporter [Cohaesibacter sp.]